MKNLIKLFSLAICIIFFLPVLSNGYVVIGNASQLIDIEPGDYTHYILHDNRTREYRVHVPPSLCSEKPPVVIALHGGMGNADTMEIKTRFSEKADEKGFLVVYPNGTANSVLTPNRRVWNSGHCCGRALMDNVDDVGFIRLVIEELKNNYKVNPSRVYITGHSNGGMMTYRLGAELSDLIAAIAPVAGTIGGYATNESPLYIIPDPLGPVSVLTLHGRLDDHVLYEGGHGNNTTGTRIDLSVHDSISFWVHHNGCSQIPRIVKYGNITIDTYSRGLKNTKVILYTIHNGEHPWPGGMYDPVQEINATDVIWDFFKNQSKNSQPGSPLSTGRQAIDPVNIKIDLKPLPDHFILEMLMRGKILFTEPYYNCGCS